MKKINGIEWKNALISGANNIENKKNAINALNVFPVPDGDTGSNMAMTISTAKNAISNINDANIANVAKAISTNMLLGARGNSGVILSQIFKGFANGFANKNEITTFDLVEAFVSAAKVAYTAVLKPIEGTILTVIREISEGLKEQVLSNTTIEEAFENIVKLARQSCNKTPELLSILKEVGVTDSGGEGLYAILEGMNAYFHGKPVTQNDGVETIDKFISDSEVYSGEFGYCTEFILEIDKLDKFNKDDFNDEDLRKERDGLYDSIKKHVNDNLSKFDGIRDSIDQFVKNVQGKGFEKVQASIKGKCPIKKQISLPGGRSQEIVVDYCENLAPVSEISYYAFYAGFAIGGFILMLKLFIFSF